MMLIGTVVITWMMMVTVVMTDDDGIPQKSRERPPNVFYKIYGPPAYKRCIFKFVIH